MTTVVNLRKARKQRDRELAAAQAAENRVRHGRTKAEKTGDKMATDRAERALDRSRLQD